MTLPAIHRVVTGHNSQGQAIVSSSGPLSKVVEVDAVPGTVFHEVWSTSETPARISNGADPTTGALILPPPMRGTRIRFVDIPADTEDFLARGAERMQQAFEQIGDVEASTVKHNSPHPLMHRTESVDYGVVMEGELTLVLDEGEVQLGAGSVVVQRGTNHAWANRSDRTCRMLFVLIAGEYDGDIEKAVKAG